MAGVVISPELGRTVDARPDTLDFRDLMYVPTLVEVPTRINLDDYRSKGVPILDQGKEGACTGFGLSTVANYLLRARKVVPDDVSVSPRMAYEIAKRFDEYPGEDYSGSSARGAMKGWYNYGICSNEVWPYVADHEDSDLTRERIADALHRPLGAYFRVNHKDVVSLHSALAEVGVLYATAKVHAGWRSPDAKGVIVQQSEILGGHAFAIVAFDDRGLWIQNSWGTDWGLGGFGLVTYDDWLANGTDVWVGRLGAPIQLHATGVALTKTGLAGAAETYGSAELRPHIVSIGNDGLLKTTGTYGTSVAQVQGIFEHFKDVSKDWTHKRILLYAHGGLVPEASAVQRVAEYRSGLLGAEVYPISFVWHSDFLSTLHDILDEALSRRRPEGLLDASKDFMLDRLDDALEPIARAIGGKAQWDEMKENATLATKSPKGGARLALMSLAALIRQDPSIEVHVAGHSAGSIFHAPLLQLLTTSGRISGGPMDGEQGLGLHVATCTMWAPACTVELFQQCYVPSIENGTVGRFALFALRDAVEKEDDCASIYHKSLLYLVSNAFEDKLHVPLLHPKGEPILGMEKFVRDGFGTADRKVAALFAGTAPKADLVLAPNSNDVGSPVASTSQHHGGFDNDVATVRATFARVAADSVPKRIIRLPDSAATTRDIRQALPVSR